MYMCFNGVLLAGTGLATCDRNNRATLVNTLGRAACTDGTARSGRTTHATGPSRSSVDVDSVRYEHYCEECAHTMCMYMSVKVTCLN